jgi:hypothetical protein
MYYSVLVMAEVLGPTNNSQVLDLPIPGSSEFTPMYGIYENGVPVRVAIFNYVDDPTGATDVHASISINGGTIPSAVKVKYLLAKTVVQKGNYTWAGQVRIFFLPSLRPQGDHSSFLFPRHSVGTSIRTGM